MQLNLKFQKSDAAIRKKQAQIELQCAEKDSQLHDQQQQVDKLSKELERHESIEQKIQILKPLLGQDGTCKRC